MNYYMPIDRTKLDVFNKLKCGDKISFLYRGEICHGHILGSIHDFSSEGYCSRVDVRYDYNGTPTYITLAQEDADNIISAAPPSVVDSIKQIQDEEDAKCLAALKEASSKLEDRRCLWLKAAGRIKEANLGSELWANPKTIQVLDSSIYDGGHFIAKCDNRSFPIYASKDIPEDHVLITYNYPHRSELKKLVETNPDHLINLDEAFLVPSIKNDTIKDKLKTELPKARNAQPILSLRSRIESISSKTYFQEIWLNMSDFSKLSYECFDNEIKKDISSLRAGHYATINNKNTIIHVGAFVPPGEIFLSDEHSKEFAEKDFKDNSYRIVDLEHIQTMSDLIDVADKIGLKEDEKAIASARYKVINPTASGSVTLTSSSSYAPTSTITVIPNFATATADGYCTVTTIPNISEPVPNIPLPEFSFNTDFSLTPVWNKFVDGLDQLTELLSKSMQAKDDKKVAPNTIYSRAFEPGMTGIRHVWANKQECIKEFSQFNCENQFVIANENTDKVIHPVDSMPPGFVFFSSQAIEPTEIQFNAQPAYILSVERGTGLSISGTKQAFDTARSIQTSLKKHSGIMIGVGQTPSTDSLSDSFSDTRKKLDELYDAVILKKNDKVKPIDPVIASMLVDTSILEKYASYNRLIKKGENLDVLSAKKFDDLLTETLHEARRDSGVKDEEAQIFFPKDPSDLGEACAAAGYAESVIDAIIASFATSGMQKTEAGRAQLQLWQEKRRAVFNHLVVAAMDNGPSYIEERAIDNRNAFRKMFKLPGIYTSFSEEEDAEEAIKLEKAMEMKMSEQFDAPAPAADYPEEYEEKVMTKSLMEDVTDTYDKAKWRVAQRQVVRRLRDALILAIGQFGHDRAEVKLFEKALKTQLGEGMLALFLGFAGSRIPFLADNPKAAKMLDESKIEGMAVIGDDVIERIATQIAPLVMGALSSSLEGLPEVRIEVKEKPKKVRIKAPKKAAEDDDEEADDEAAEAEAKPAKRASADAR